MSNFSAESAEDVFPDGRLPRKEGVLTEGVLLTGTGFLPVLSHRVQFVFLWRVGGLTSPTMF